MRNILSFVFLVIALLSTAGVSAADKTPAATHAGKPERCLTLSAIRNMTVLDRKTLLFEMPAHKFYVNHLPHACPGMDIGFPILYKTSLNLLCNLDMITVLDPVGGGFQRGPSCGLGMFVPIGRVEAEKMMKQRKH